MSEKLILELSSSDEEEKAIKLENALDFSGEIIETEELTYLLERTTERHK